MALAVVICVLDGTIRSEKGDFRYVPFTEGSAAPHSWAEAFGDQAAPILVILLLVSSVFCLRHLKNRELGQGLLLKGLPAAILGCAIYLAVLEGVLMASRHRFYLNTLQEREWRESLPFSDALIPPAPILVGHFAGMLTLFTISLVLAVVSARYCALVILNPVERE